MHCLLCYEKIPRLRAWTGKSEFCCDEHAELYKKQTMDRLLFDDSQSKDAPPALPIFDGDAASVAASVDHVLLKGQPKKAKRAKDASEAADVDELWKLAERMGGHQEESPAPLLLQDIPSESQGGVQTQSGEEALAALQSLAAEATRDSPAGGDLLDEFSSMESALEGLLEAQAEALEPPELAADFDAGQEESSEPPDAVLEGLLAVPDASDEQSSELSDPPEPADCDRAAADEAVAARPAAAPVARRAHKAAPRLRAATEWLEMTPSPNLPEGGSALKPWTDALASAGPDRSSLLNPTKFLEMRKASLNGTASATFDPVQFQASEPIAAVPVPIWEPTGSAVSYESQDDALPPSSAFARPAPFHADLIAAEMRLNGTAESVSGGEAFSVKQPALSAEFLSRVALKSRILAPKCSTILSPSERDVFASASAEEAESGGEYASAAGRSDRDETDGGERAHVADLF